MNLSLFVSHIHTSYSYDCVTNPKHIVEASARNGIRSLLICDHDTVEGAVAAQFYASRMGIDLFIPVAAEYATDAGDIIVANVPKTFTGSRNCIELCERAKQARASVILPHPYKGHVLEKIDMASVDAIEVFNSRCSMEQNEEATNLAIRERKPMVFGSDAHRLSEMLNAVMACEGDNPFAWRLWPLRLMPVPASSIAKSQLIKGIKTRNVGLVTSSTKTLATRTLCQWLPVRLSKTYAARKM